MQAAIVTVGDELLAGDIENTNATWLAARLSDSGVRVREIAVVPDEVGVIAERVRGFAGAVDAVVVTGGLGATPDDVTIAGVARAFDRDLAVDESARADVQATFDRIREERPDLDLALDVEAEATLPAGSRPILNPVGISPGCVVENVYVLPGIPAEMEAAFAVVADEFQGDRVVRTFPSVVPESNAAGVLADAAEEFGVSVGSYPGTGDREKRITVTGADEEAVEAAAAWLEARL